jgi:hypothetical protein
MGAPTHSATGNAVEITHSDRPGAIVVRSHQIVGDAPVRIDPAAPYVLDLHLSDGDAPTRCRKSEKIAGVSPPPDGVDGHLVGLGHDVDHLVFAVTEGAAEGPNQSLEAVAIGRLVGGSRRVVHRDPRLQSIRVLTARAQLGH